jgi:hypothetical protein
MLPFVKLAGSQTGPSRVGTTFGLPPDPLSAALAASTGAFGAFGQFQNQQQALAQNQQFLNQQAQQMGMPPQQTVPAQQSAPAQQTAPPVQMGPAMYFPGYTPMPDINQNQPFRFPTPGQQYPA